MLAEMREREVAVVEEKEGARNSVQYPPQIFSNSVVKQYFTVMAKENGNSEKNRSINTMDIMEKLPKKEMDERLIMIKEDSNALGSNVYGSRNEPRRDEKELDSEECITTVIRRMSRTNKWSTEDEVILRP
uniref:Uncharacterized protein n=1 Tax=Elaeophora elaphi TaxID=1147741 RepID=A0A0R3S342_9BILA